MDKKNILIIVLIIIIIGLIAAMAMSSLPAKKDSKIKITSDKEQFEGGEISIKLTDLNNTPISKEIVNITITNKKGKVVVDDVVRTDSKGKAKLDLDLKKGKYVVNVSYGGNENYTGCNTTQKLTIKEEVVEAQASSSSSSSSQRYVYDDAGTYDTYSGTYVGGQNDGQTREQVEKYNHDIVEEEKAYKRKHGLD